MVQPMSFCTSMRSPLKYNSDVDTSEEAEKVNHTLGYDREGDRLYRYKLIDNKLVEPQLLFSIQLQNRPSS